MIGVSPSPLANKADIVRGVTFSKGDAVAEPREGYTPVLRAGNIQGHLILDRDLVYIPERMISDKQKLRRGDIVMCTSSGSVEVVGKTAFADQEWTGSFGAFCAVVRPKPDKCDSRYLFHYLQTPRFREWTRNSSGVGIKNIRKSELDSYELLFPSLDEQRRIAAILDKADAIRRKREQALAYADDLIRSVFLEMFGDPIVNAKGLKTKPLGEFGKIVTGNTPPRSDPENYGDAIEWIKSDNVNTEEHFLTRAVEGLSAKGKLLGRIVPTGSILVTCIAGSPSSIGRAAIADRPVALNQQINAITPYNGVNLYFLYAQFLIGKALIMRSSTNSMKGMVSKGDFQKIEFLDPAPSEQEKFGKVFEKQIQARSLLREASIQAADLFKALSQRAFRGEL